MLGNPGELDAGKLRGEVTAQAPVRLSNELATGRSLGSMKLL